MLPHQIDREGEDDDESKLELDNDDNGDDAYPVDLTVKYAGEENKKGSGGRCRYRDDDDIEALHGLYEDTKDYDGDCGEQDDDWGDME